MPVGARVCMPYILSVARVHKYLCNVSAYKCEMCCNPRLHPFWNMPEVELLVQDLLHLICVCIYNMWIDS